MTDQFITGDCRNVLPQLPEESVDLVVTSPPYNQDVAYEDHMDALSHSEYIAWLKDIFFKIHRVLKFGGRVCINVGDGNNGAIPTHSDIIQFMQDLSYIPMTTIIWDKKNCSSRTSWGSFKSPSCPSFPTPFEYILVFAKGSRKLQTKGETDLTKDEFIEWSLPIWFVQAKDYMATTALINRGVHPAPYPEEIPKRCIKMFSWKDAVVLDPFAGYGTTAVACKKYDRRYICIELSETYAKKALKRLENLSVMDSLFGEEDLDGKI